MTLILQRGNTVIQNNGYTPGEIRNDGEHFCFTLEDELREIKVRSETAIPAGTYELELVDSPKFGQDTISLKNVEGFGFIRIHAGNTEKDTEGCILVGEGLHGNTIMSSRIALQKFKDLVVPLIKSGVVVHLSVLNAVGDRYVDTGRAV